MLNSGQSSDVGTRLVSLADSKDSSSALEKISPLVGNSEAVHRLRLQIERIGPYFRTVLIRGEVGTGKEFVARALHAKSGGHEDSFSVCQAAQLADTTTVDLPPENQIQPLLRSRGTLFLDNVEELPASAQHKLSRVLNQKTNAKLVVASSQDLRALAASGLFRQDLYQRLAMIEIVLEPLRRRAEDIPALARHFLHHFALQYGKSIDAMEPDVLERLVTYAWPGNVRELENTLQNSVLQCDEKLLRLDALTPFVEQPEVSTQLHVLERHPAETVMRLQDVIERHVLRVLQECSGNKVRAAELLGISRSTLYRTLEGCSAHMTEPQI